MANRKPKPKRGGNRGAAKFTPPKLKSKPKLTDAQKRTATIRAMGVPTQMMLPQHQERPKAHIN